MNVYEILCENCGKSRADHRISATPLGPVFECVGRLSRWAPTISPLPLADSYGVKA